MSVGEQLFNRRVLESHIRAAKTTGLKVPSNAASIVSAWSKQLDSGALDRLTEGQVEQTFNSEIFGKLLGYRQVGEGSEATLLPKGTSASGRDIPDFVLGHIDPAAGTQEWIVVGEVKDSRTDLDQPQTSRKNKETPVEQGFRYASKGRPGIEWIVISNFREVRLYKNGYAGAYVPLGDIERCLSSMSEANSGSWMRPRRIGFTGGRVAQPLSHSPLHISEACCADSARA